MKTAISKKSKENYAYFDYAASTPLDARVLSAMMPYFKDESLQGNPSSMHSLGRYARAKLNGARRKVADILGGGEDEIVFTSSGTEADNLALFGTARSYGAHGKNIIVSAIEHKAVLSSARELSKEGFSIFSAPVDKNGVVDIPKLISLLDDDTVLVSIMLVNNEVGSIQPIKKIANAIKEFRGSNETPLLHVDACQAAGIIKIHPYELGADLLALNGSKIYGPKGVGCLWIRRGVKISPVMRGGGQEFGLRSGTENAAFAVGFAKALSIAQNECLEESKRLSMLSNILRDGLRNIGNISFNSPEFNVHPGILNVSFYNTEGESLLLELDRYGICCSTGSACAAGDLKPSHVLISMGISEELAHSSLRFSMGRFTSSKDIEYLLKMLPIAVSRIRSICPVNILK